CWLDLRPVALRGGVLHPDRWLLGAKSSPSGNGGNLGVPSGRLSVLHSRVATAGGRTLSPDSPGLEDQHQPEVLFLLRVSGAARRRAVIAVSLCRNQCHARDFLD